MKSRARNIKTIIKTTILITGLVIGFNLFFSQSDFITRAGRNFFAPVLTYIYDIKNSVEDFFGSRYLAKIEALKLENEMLRKNQLSTVQYEQKIDRLYGLLNLKNKYKEEFTITAAKVVSYNPEHSSGTLLINKGADHGIYDGDAVVCGEGIIGIVKKAEKHYSVVSTIYNNDLSVAVRVMPDGVATLVCGDKMVANEQLCKLAFLSDGYDINIGDLVETMGGVFPEGICVGKINDRRIDDNGDYFTVKPLFDLYKTYEVLVIDNNYKNQNFEMD